MTDEPIDKIETEEQKTPEMSAAEKAAGELFDKYKTGKERVDEILVKINPIIDCGLFDAEGIKQELEACADLEDKNEFTERTTSILRPIIELRARDPEAFMKLRLAKTPEQEKEQFIELNDVFSYNEIPNLDGKKSFLIHLPVDEEKRKRLGLLGIGRLFEQGMHDLAQITETNPEITKVEATSTLVKKYQRLMKNLGFTVTGAIGEELRAAHFSDTKPGEVFHSEMSRQEFLEKYLEKENE